MRLQGLRRAHAGDAGFDDGVDLRLLLLDGHVCARHAAALAHREPDGNREQHEQHQRNLPLDAHHDDDRAHERDRREDDVLRAVVRHLRDGEEIGGHAAHQLARAALIKERKAHVLQMLEEILAHVGLHVHAAAVADDGHDIAHDGLDEIGAEQKRHDDEKRAELPRREQLAHGAAAGRRHEEICKARHQHAAHVDRQQFSVRTVIRQEDAEGFLMIITNHDEAPSDRSKSFDSIL